MIEKKIGSHLVKMYENIDEMPIHLYAIMNEYSLIDYEIGNSMEDINRLFYKMDMQLVQKNFDAVIQIRKNLHQTFYNMINRNDNKVLQFACFIHSVDGVEVKDYSHENLKSLMHKLGQSGLNVKEVKNTVSSSKKKIKDQLKAAFPKRYSDSDELNHRQLIRDRIVATLEYVRTHDVTYEKRKQMLDANFAEIMRPKNLDGNSPENVLIKTKRDFEKLCVAMMEKGVHDPDKMTILRFNSALELYESQKSNKNAARTDYKR